MHARSPGEVLLNVNQHLMEMNAQGLFATVLYGVLEQGSGRFAYARAGHELPLLRLEDGRISQTTRGVGQPVGIFETPLIDEQVMEIPPGAMLVLYTDGVTDERDRQGEIYGKSRFEEMVHDLPAVSAQAACDQIMEAVSRFLQGAQQDDDVTVVAVQNLH
jgi:sigma-B regulation protein RsbU (phosphoserine phosphatase)